MGRAQFRSHDPIARCGDIEKTTFTKPLPEYGAVFPAIKALVSQEFDVEFLVQYLVEVQVVVLEDQIILDGISNFGLHFSQYALVLHKYWSIDESI
jgi:hypothetical protein